MSTLFSVWSLFPNGLPSATPLMRASLLVKTQSMQDGLSVPLARVAKSTSWFRYDSMMASLKLSGSLLSLFSVAS